MHPTNAAIIAGLSAPLTELESELIERGVYTDADIRKYRAMRAVDTLILPAAPATEFGNTAFYPLPPELWRKCDMGAPCRCPACQPFPLAVPLPDYWDTLAVGSDGKRWTVHFPEIHPGYKVTVSA